MKRLFSGWCRQSVVDALERELSATRAELSAVREQLTTNDLRYNTLLSSTSALSTERDALALKLRAQTEADLLLVSLKIIKAAVDGNGAEAARQALHQAELQRAFIEMQPRPPYLAGLGPGWTGPNSLGTEVD